MTFNILYLYKYNKYVKCYNTGIAGLRMFLLFCVSDGWFIFTAFRKSVPGESAESRWSLITVLLSVSTRFIFLLYPSPCLGRPDH